MRTLFTAVICGLLVTLAATAGGTQTASAPPVGIPLPSLRLRTELLAGLPRRTVNVTEETGETAAYSGVDLGVLLGKNGAPQGAALRGAALADYVLVRAADGYRAVFALAELDAAVSTKIIMVADERNGVPLPAKSGPYQIVVPDEKHHMRWVRNVIGIDVVAAP